jgi:predicted Zn-dependent peptidase
MSAVEVTRLGNGITVATHQMPHLESVALGLWVGAGARSEAPREHGISHLLEHMAFKGTSRRSAREIAEAVETVGGEMNAETSVDSTVYYLRLLKGDVGLGLDVLGDIVGDPLLDPEELALEQHVILQEIGAAHDVPEDWVFELFQQAAFPGQAIGRTVLGTPESISAHTSADLRRFLHAHYSGPRIVLAAAGHLDHAEVARLAETHFGNLPSHRPAEPEPGVYKGGERRETRAVKEAQVLLGFRAPRNYDRRFTATHLFSAILGGGMASRLFQELRESRGLCYSVYSFYWPFDDTGVFGIQAATSEEDLTELVPLALEELHKMTDGVTRAELDRAKAQLRAGLLMALESPIARAGQIARHILVHGRPLTLEEMVENVESVSGEDLAALAGEMLSNPTTLAAIGPVRQLPSLADLSARMSGGKTAVGF